VDSGCLNIRLKSTFLLQAITIQILLPLLSSFSIFIQVIVFIRAHSTLFGHLHHFLGCVIHHGPKIAIFDLILSFLDSMHFKFVIFPLIVLVKHVKLVSLWSEITATSIDLRLEWETVNLVSSFFHLNLIYSQVFLFLGFFTSFVKTWAEVLPWWSWSTWIRGHCHVLLLLIHHVWW